MDEKFLQSWFCREHTVLGRALKPFCLAHRLALEAIDSPLCYQARPFTFIDLALAVRICVSSNPKSAIRNPHWIDRVRFWRAAFDPAYFRYESQKFVAYLEDFSAAPKFWNRLNQPVVRESIPWVLNVASALLRCTSLSEDEVWSMPMGKALWYFAALAKQEGADLDILTSEDEKLLESLKGGNHGKD